MEGDIFVGDSGYFKNPDPTSTFEKLTVRFVSCSMYNKMKL